MLNIEMKDFLENGDTTDFSHTRMNIHFRELGRRKPALGEADHAEHLQGGQAGDPALGLQTLRGAVPPEIRPLAQRAVLFPHGNEEQVERGFPDGLYPVQDRGQESAEAHRHSGTGHRPGAQLQRGAGDGGEKRRAHGVCRPAVHHTGRQAAGHRAVREGRRQAPDHPGGERRPRGGKTD